MKKSYQFKFLCVFLLFVTIFSGCRDEFTEEAITEVVSESVGNIVAESEDFLHGVEPKDAEEPKEEFSIEDKEETTAAPQIETEEVQEPETDSETDIKTDIRQFTSGNKKESPASAKPSTDIKLSASEIPTFSGTPYVVINDNVPFFSETDLSTTSYEYYSNLDLFGRCGVVYACIGPDLMPTEERGNIGQVKPSGWHTVKYEIVDGNYLYNRCHLIGYQLTGENANTSNLITGTRYMNVEGMLPFENMVADYVQETGNHVLYRVTPIFEGDNLLANGVQLEAMSVEDKGEGILFHVYCYNTQPGIIIDYTTGESELDPNYTESSAFSQNKETMKASDETTASGTSESAPTYNCSSCEATYNSQSKADACNATHTSTSDTNNLYLVWISATGEKYHSINHCGRMNPDKAYQMSEDEAVTKGYGKCSKCW